MSRGTDFQLALFIGARYARTRRGNGFVSFLSLFSGLGITLGVAVLIIVMSVMNGFESELHTRILGMVTHVTVKKAPDQNPHIGNWETLLQKLEAKSEVLAAAPVVKMQGMLSSHGAVSGVELNGILPEKEKGVSIFPNYMTQGKVEHLQYNDQGLIVGATLARKLALKIGDKVTFVYPEGRGIKVVLFRALNSSSLVEYFP